MISVLFEILDIETLGFHLFVTVQVNGNSVRMVLDTGASQTVFNTLLMDELSISYEPKDGFSMGVGSSELVSYTAQIDNFEIGGHKKTDYSIVAMDLKGINEAYATLNIPEIGGILGSDFFVENNAIINYVEKTLYLNPKPINS